MKTKFVLSGLLALSIGAAGLLAQSKTGYVVPKTPWGDPDLQEIWSSEDLRDIPYERPDAVQGRALLTDEEFAEREAATNRARSPARRDSRTARKHARFARRRSSSTPTGSIRNSRPRR